MRTRCPVCATVFRVTSEQLRLKAGKVRCGHCQALFNAFDQMVTNAPEPREAPEAVLPEAPVIIAAQSVGELAETELTDTPPTEIIEPEPEPEPELSATLALNVEAPPAAFSPDIPVKANQPEILVFERPAEVSVTELAQEQGRALPSDSSAESVALEESSLLAAREAGLMAVRELSDTPAFNRWAAGTLASSGVGDFDNEPTRPAVWPFVLFSLILLFLLLAQLLYYFRTEVVQRLPSSASLYAMARIEVPLPRNADLVTIETSDLQFDNQRGLFVLQASLRNRAAYAQAWPALELTLTDTHDTVVSRRVLSAAEFLQPGAPSSFGANGEVAVNLWIEAKDSGAAGYRLYLFYP